MSNTNTNSFEFEVAPYTDVPETLPETEEVTQTKAPAPKKKKKRGACRLFSLLLIAVSVLALFLPVQVIKGFQPEKATLLASITDLFGSGASSKLFDMLPVYTDATNVTGMFAGLVFYALIIAIVCTVFFGLLALLSGNAGLFRLASFFFATGFGTYAICGYALPTIKGTAGVLGMDVTMVAIASVGAFLYLVLSFAKKGPQAFTSLFQLLFTLVFVKATVLILKNFTAEVTTTVESFGLTSNLTLQIFMAVIWVVSILGAIRLLAKKGLAIDMLRYIVQLVVGALLVYVALTAKSKDAWLFNYAAVAAVVSFAQIILCNLQIKSGKPKKEKKQKEEEEYEDEYEYDIPVAQPIPDPVPEYIVEEYAEAFPYDGGPVEGVEVAQEVNPTFLENPINPGPVNTAGYDFYNSKSFDPFIAILNTEERNQFTELFILKYKGMMPEIPDYQVGGDNKEFFRKLFIYLGQYRDRIPDGLLSKIYQFAIRNA